jgi:S-(hydroxymethyl)mycothiol dehydrogenase
MTLEMPLIDFFSHGGALKSSWYGDCLPERDFPTLISLYLQGRLPLEKFVSERIGLGDIDDAFHKMHAGEVLRSVVVMK